MGQIRSGLRELGDGGVKCKLDLSVSFGFIFYVKELVREPCVHVISPCVLRVSLYFAL